MKGRYFASTFWLRAPRQTVCMSARWDPALGMQGAEPVQQGYYGKRAIKHPVRRGRGAGWLTQWSAARVRRG